MILLSSFKSFILQISLDGIISSVKELGFVNGIALIAISIIAYLFIKKYEGINNKLIDGKQAEINRLAEENKHYRETFMEMMKANGFKMPGKNQKNKKDEG